MKVLLVDDEPVILDLLGFAFSRKEVPVEKAEDAEAALELVRKTKFDAALVDKNLPGMSGLQLIARIRETDSDMAILMMTGYASAETAAEALNLGVDAYLEKPFPNMATVVDRVVDALKKRRASRPAPPAPATSPATPAPAPAPPPVPQVPARVLLVASPELEGSIRGVLLADDVVTVARKETELLKAIAEPCDVVAIDSFLLGGEVVPIVERVQRVSPAAEFVVLSDRALDLRTVQKLIELGVRRLVQSGAWARPVRSALDAVRRKKAAG